MKKFQKGLLVFLLLCLILGVSAVGVSAAATVDRGTCGDDLTWTLDSAGTLTISGTGKMREFSFYAPWECSAVKKVTIKPGVTSICDYAFYECDKLVAVSIADSVTSIGEEAFSLCCSLPRITIPGSVTRIGDSAFYYCISMTDVVFQNGVRDTGDYIFSQCEMLKKVTLPKTLTRLGEGAFYGCSSLTEITLPDSLTGIGAGAFSGSSIVHVDVPQKITTIEDRTFSFCHELKSVKLPEGVTHIGDSAFSNCGFLANLTLPASVCELGEYVFYNSPSLKTVIFRGNVPAFDPNTFYSVKTVAYYPVGNRTWTKAVLQNYGGTVTWSCNTPVQIQTQPKATDTKLGGTARLRVAATGDGLTYKWCYKNVGQTKYTESTQTGPVYSVKMSAATRNQWVCCLITDRYGVTVKSDVVLLRMAATVTKQPATAFARYGTNAKVTVKAAGDGLTYTWYHKNAGAAKFTRAAGKTATYVVKMNGKTKDRHVYCVITDRYGNAVKTKTVQLRMAASVYTQPKNVTVAKRAKATVRLTALGDGLAYRWYYKDPGDAKFTLAPKITGRSYSAVMNAARNGRKVYCVVSDCYGKTVKSTVVTLRMK